MFFKYNQIKEIKKFYFQNGFVVIKKFFPKNKISKLKNEILKKTTKDYNIDFYYENDGKKNFHLRRIEKITNYNKNIKDIAKSEKIKKILKLLTNGKQTLFKDKLNFKLPKGDGFLPHFDGHFYWRDKDNKLQKGWKKYSNQFTNIAVPLENSNIKNGCLYIAPKKDTDRLGLNWKSITQSLITNTPNIKKKDLKKFNFLPFDVKEGDVIIFNWLCAHYSPKNKSNKSRMLIYLTYCSNSKIKNLRDSYYFDKKYSLNSRNYKGCIYNEPVIKKKLIFNNL